MAKSVHSPSWLKALEPKHDFFELLEKQAQLAQESFLAVEKWFDTGALKPCEVVHDCEHRADAIKEQIEDDLRDSFVTPFDREEIYDLSERIDHILSGAKMLVQDVEFIAEDDDTVAQAQVDQYLVKMSAELAHSTDLIRQTIMKLKDDIKEAEKIANEVRKAHTRVAKIYRPAMKDAYSSSDFRDLTRKKQLYDCMAGMAANVSQVGQELVHLIIKSS